MDTSEILWQTAIALFGALTGVGASNLLPGKKTASRTGSTNDFSGSTFHGEVRVGDTVLNVTEDRRVYINVGAAAAIATHPNDSSDSERESQKARRLERERERQREREHQAELKRIRQSGREEEDAATVVMMYIGAAVAVLAVIAVVAYYYLVYRQEVTLTVRLIASFALAFALAAVVNMAIRKVRLSVGLTLQVLLNIALSLAALYSLNWLSGPPAGVDRKAFAQLLERTDITVPMLFGMAFDEANRPLFYSLTYQIAGVALLAASLLVVFCHTISIFAISGHAVRVQQNPAMTAGGVRRSMMRLLGGPAVSWRIAMGTGVFALLLIAGLGNVYVSQLQKFGDTQEAVDGPPSSPAPVSPSG